MSLFSSMLLATNITSNADSYIEEEDIWIQIHDVENNPQDWIGIYPKGSNNSWINVLSWTWTKGTNSKGYKFNLTKGEYEARFFLNNSYKIKDTLSFSVVEKSIQSSIETSKETYLNGNKVIVTLKNFKNTANAWLGIYPKESSSAWSNVIKWRWIQNSNTTQNYLFDLDVGEYEARIFFHNSYKIEKRTSFKVIKEIRLPSLTTSQETYKTDENISLNVKDLPSNNGDWIGIYPKDSNNNWENVLLWSYTNGTKSMEKSGIKKGSIHLKGLRISGEYEARLFFNNSYTVEKKISFIVEESLRTQEPKLFGAREVTSTPIETGTHFASPTGTGKQCSKETPCLIQTAITQLHAGDVLFLRGGTYPIKNALKIQVEGVENNPIIIESYPNEHAVLDGQNKNLNDVKSNKYSTENGIWLLSNNDYVHIRKIEVKNMAREGITISSSHNLVEGCIVHDNYLIGIQVNDGDNGEVDYVDGYNVIKDNTVYNNSDIGLNSTGSSSYSDGGNADGIQIVGGTSNKITHNTIYQNSDDGIDTWLSNDSVVTFNISYNNGGGTGNSNGTGIKAGGNKNNHSIGLRSVVKHNMVYGNKARGIDYNDGEDVQFKYNTSWNNGSVGFKSDDNTLVEHNIASGNGQKTYTYSNHFDNSWQHKEEVVFITTDVDSPDFLKPVSGSKFENMGAYSHLDN